MTETRTYDELLQKALEQRDTVEEADDDSECSLSSGKPAYVWKPDLSQCADAVVDGRLSVPRGEKVLIEYAPAWRDTGYFRIEKIDLETGDLRLYDLNRHQYAMHNFKRAAAVGDALKVPTPDRQWSSDEDEQLSNEMKRRGKRFVMNEPDEP